MDSLRTKLKCRIKLKGRCTAAYPALEPDIKAAGAEFVNAEAVIDGEMVSARAWPDHLA